ncbi:hypothetical protein DCS_07590 [Drechmeria coniospora]|uniref:Uncharacterized protein n=1 Tax=Drechmeria coniospora TaxID=98403 RepID=A0A151GEV2_DRECN|nr:hypothetical protein DCS_07590 [Drechmeria coniospora]KYK55627.1 hypothetical protein DCS_07590 [Drechmeria coniospora]
MNGYRTMQRRLSEPVGATPPTLRESFATDAAVAAGIMETTAPIPARSDRTLLSKADALAKMTVELNLRVVSAQAERLEREIKELVACTAQDRQFRKKNEERMTDMMREIWSIKLRMDEVAVGHTDVDALFTRCQRETEELRLQLRADVDDLRKQIDEALSRLDSLPCPADVEAEVATGNRQSLLAEATSLKLAREGAPHPVKLLATPWGGFFPCAKLGRADETNRLLQATSPSPGGRNYTIDPPLAQGPQEVDGTRIPVCLGLPQAATQARSRHGRLHTAGDAEASPAQKQRAGDQVDSTLAGGVLQGRQVDGRG